ncbi:MAG: chemotaxis protein methyltransferase CheR [Polaribacter sp.]|jgi:chemotaxis protein methyltransferase CheR
MEISASEYDRFKSLLEHKSGILLGDNKQYLVTSRLANFIKECDLSNLSDLLAQIEQPTNRQLLQKVIDRMTTNETLWFRDGYPFEYMKKTLIPEFNKKGSFKIWCAACSSGQEPFSLAMLLYETGAFTNGSIIATDLSVRILEKAKLGQYQDIELKRGLPADKLRKYFDAIDTNNWQLKSNLRNKIRYQATNLLNAPFSLGKFEIIFCRNVLIYFSQENKTKVLNGLIDSLKPGGYLFLGASESLTKDCEKLDMIRCNPGLVYQKAL